MDRPASFRRLREQVKASRHPSAIEELEGWSRMTFDIFSGRGRPEFTAAAYLAAVEDTVLQAFDRAVSEIPSGYEGEVYHEALTTIIEDIALVDDEAVREVLAFSPHLFEVTVDQVDGAVLMAKTNPHPKVRTCDVLSCIAFFAFERDLWAVLWPLYKARYYGTSQVWTDFFDRKVP